MRNCTRRVSRYNRRRSVPALLLGLLMLMCLSPPAVAQDRWFGPDKFIHFIGGFLVTSVSYSVARNAFDWDHDRARIFGAATGVTLSVGKELFDMWSGRGVASGKDLVWDGLGIGAGMILINQLKPENGSIPPALMLTRCGISAPGRGAKPAELFPLKAVDTQYRVPTLRLISDGLTSNRIFPEGD